MNRVEEIAGYARLCHKMGYVCGSSGNVSVRIDDTVWISRTGAMLGTLNEADFIPVDSTSGQPYREGIPSKELPMHMAVYRSCPEGAAIFHLHPLDCIAAGIRLGPEAELPLYAPAHYVKLGLVGQTGLFKAGSQSLAKEVGEIFKRDKALLLYLVEACRLHLKLDGYGAMTPQELENYILMSKD